MQNSFNKIQMTIKKEKPVVTNLKILLTNKYISYKIQKALMKI